MFGLPIIGPILQMFIGPVFDWLGKKEDTKTVEIKTTGAVKQSQIVADTEELRLRAQVLDTMKLDPGTRVNRDLIMFPVSFWIAIKVYTLVFANLIPDYVWEIVDWPENIKYIPYAVIAYLFAVQIEKWIKR